MALPALFIASMALRTVGNIKANLDQAAMEEQNAKEMRLQAQYAEWVKKQEIGLVDRKFSRLAGEQTMAYVAGGVDAGSGSAAMTLADTLYVGAEEALRVKNRYDEEIRMANARASRSGALSANLRDPLTNLLQIGSIGLDGTANMLAASSRFAGEGPQGKTR
jgi:hypothetical protein